MTTIVSTNMVYPISANYDAKVFETLTGFKWIGEKVRQFEKEDSYKLMFGFEESYGCIIAPHARDKDGISAVMALCEMAAFYKGKGISLYEQMQKIYEKYGFYDEYEPNMVLEGIEGAERIGRMMDYIRSNPPKEIAGREVVKIIDYKDGSEDIRHPENKIPGTNALRYFLKENDPELKDSDTWFSIRPSGTEPKIKFYFYTKQTSREKAIEANKEISKAVMDIINAVE
jgi:phosphoglucomutase